MGAENDKPIDRFYRMVLSWDFKRIVETDLIYGKGETTGEGLGLRQVKDVYTDVDDYVSTYEPLLFQEVKSMIASNTGQCKTTFVKQCQVDADGFHMAIVHSFCFEGYQTDEGKDKERKVKCNDLLLLSKPQLWSKSKVLVEKSLKIYAFALVESLPSKGFMMLRLYLPGEFRDLDTKARLAKVRSLVTSECEEDRLFDITKICSLSTIAREYIALRSIGSLERKFRDLILAPSKGNLDVEAHSLEVSRPLQKYMEDNLNAFQQKAVQAVLSRQPFVLIQGPPGTGKTQTILALLSFILHATPAKAGVSLQKRKLSTEDKFIHWRLASRWLSGCNQREKTMPVNGDEGFFPNTGNELKPEAVGSTRKYRARVLVCAPSNSALDEIVLRVMKNGMRDDSDRSYCPKIVRVGVKPHHSVRRVFIDEQVERVKRTMGGAKQDGDDHVLRARILDESVIVFSTLSSSDPSQFKWGRGFDAVIIDEAAQAVEPAILLPLENRCKQVFLIGDPDQLPATVTSSIANEYGYGRSMFERFKSAKYPVTKLNIQYRMHPEIRSFPSKEFYENLLEDGPNIKNWTKCLWHEYSCFGPFCFFDLHKGKESKLQAGGSWVNVDEVEFVLNLYYKLVSQYPVLKSSNNFAIISPYRAQVDLLKERFKSTFGVDSEKEVEITTVDGCQGREKDVAIFSCVRASHKGNIGFVDDRRRMNVGITRARASILVVGSASTLKRNAIHWKNLVKSAKKRRCLIKVSKPYTDFFSYESLESMRIKEEVIPSEKIQTDKLDHDMPTITTGVADEIQANDNDYSDGGDGGDGDEMNVDDEGYGDD